MAALVGLFVVPGGRLDAAAPKPARVGIFRVDGQLTVRGDSSGSVSDAGGSVSWGDGYSLSLTAQARYEVLQRGTNAYTGDLLDSTASLSAGGGGQSSFKSKYESDSTLWTYEPPSDFDPTEPRAGGGFSSEDGQAYASTGYQPSMKLSPEGVSAFTGGFQAALEAYFGVGTSFEFEVPRRIEGWSFSQTHTTNVVWTGPGLPGTALGNATCTVTVAFIPDAPPQWEAILEPGTGVPDPASTPYEHWLPIGSRREGVDEPGNGLPARVFLQAKDGGPGIPPRAKFKFYLGDVSREPGVSMNFPPREAAGCDTTPSGPFDLRIFPNDKLRVADDGQSAETFELSENAGVGIACYDFGAYGRLKVIAETEDGLTLVAHRKGRSDATVLDIPLDENQNHVADGWEKEKGVWDRNLSADWDGADDPAGQAVKGDGISMYEKYRGFEVLNGAGKEMHERLDPKRKHVFVRNPDRLVREVFETPEGIPESYLAAAECEVRYLGPYGWSGPGTFKGRNRVVNFNCSEDKHAVDQHALHVVVVTSPNPASPEDLNDLVVSLGMDPLDPLKSDTEGVTYVDPTAPGELKNLRPAMALRIEVYWANVKGYVKRSLVYHSKAACPACTPAELKDLAAAYEADHLPEAGRKKTIELSSTITHEMGHGTGILHHKPTSDSPADAGLKNCTMRYYAPSEFPRDIGDRFELNARGNNPDSFCRRKHNCWGHLRINDNLGAAAGAEAGEAAVPVPASLRRPALAPATSVAVAGVAEPALLEISADLAWDEAIAGDPLRVWVRLHGPTDGVAANWVAGVRLRLSRVLPDNRVEEVLSPGAWSGFLQPNAFEATSLGIANLTRTAEWIAPSDPARLTAGRYQLEVNWEGRGLAPGGILPAGEIATLAAIPFEVAPATTVAQQALHQRHLAWERYIADDAAGAVACVREADRLDPSGADPIAQQSRLVAASASARMRDAFGAAQFLEAIRTLGGDDNDHLAGFAMSAFSGLAPRLELIGTPVTGSAGPTRLQVTAVPAGTYIVQRSTDLATWIAISTNTPAANRFEVAEPDIGTADHRYYRVRWLR